MNQFTFRLWVKTVQSLDDYRFLYACTDNAKFRGQYLFWLTKDLIALDRILGR